MVSASKLNNITKGISYEIMAVSAINKYPNIERAVRWPDISEQDLLDSGFITSSNKHRIAKGKARASKQGKVIVNTLQDVGIDIIVKNKDGTFDLVQCKNYENTLSPNDLGTFFMIMLSKVHQDKKGFVYHSQNKLSRQFIEHKMIDRIKFVHLEIPDEKEEKIINVTLHPYQKIVVDECINYYKNNDKGIISMPCGTGKTIISCFSSKQYDVVIFISPLKQFAEQNITRYKEYDNSREYMLVDSDGERDVEKIKKFIEKNRKLNKKILLSSTYNSCDVIIQLFDDKSFIPFIIIDEFHNLTAKNIYGIEKIKENKIKIRELKEDDKDIDLENGLDEDDFKEDDSDEKKDDLEEVDPEEVDSEDDEDIEKDALNIIITSKYKTLYLSATPRIYELEGDDDYDTELLGKTIYKMDYKTAIDNGYISDYLTYIPVHEDESKNELAEIIKDIDTELEKNDVKTKLDNLKLSQKCCYLFESIKKLGKLKCIIYFQSHKDIDMFIEYFYLINEYYYFYDYTMDSIKCTDSKKDRHNKIEKFTNDTNHSFLCAVAILDECIDIKKCNSVYITYNCTSKISNVQRISRAMRLDEENYNKKASIILWCDKIDDVLMYISSVKEIDANYSEKIRYIQFNKELIKNDTKTQKKYELRYEKFIMGVQEYRGFSWRNNLKKIIEYMKTNGERPPHHSKNEETEKLARWLQDQCTHYNKKTKVMKIQDIYNTFSEFLKEYAEHFRTRKDDWYIKLNKVQKYIDDNNKPPPCVSDDEYIDIIGRWFHRQMHNFVHKEGTLKNLEIYNAFLDFKKKNNILTLEEKWYFKLEECIKYIKEFNRKPPSKLKWLSEQSYSYKKIDCIMKKQPIRDEWEKFVYDHKSLYKDFVKIELPINKKKKNK